MPSENDTLDFLAAHHPDTIALRRQLADAEKVVDMLIDAEGRVGLDPFEILDSALDYRERWNDGGDDE